MGLFQKLLLGSNSTLLCPVQLTPSHSPESTCVFISTELSGKISPIFSLSFWSWSFHHRWPSPAYLSPILTRVQQVCFPVWMHLHSTELCRHSWNSSEQSKGVFSPVRGSIPCQFWWSPTWITAQLPPYLQKAHQRFLLHPAFCSLTVFTFPVPPMAGSPPNLNSACQKLSSSLFLNIFPLLSLKLPRISSHLACCRSSKLCRLQLLSFLPQMFYQRNMPVSSPWYHKNIWLFLSIHAAKILDHLNILTAVSSSPALPTLTPHSSHQCKTPVWKIPLESGIQSVFDPF